MPQEYAEIRGNLACLLETRPVVFLLLYARLAALKPVSASHLSRKSSGITKAQAIHLAFTWVVGIQTLALVLVSHWLSHHPSPQHQLVL